VTKQIFVRLLLYLAIGVLAEWGQQLIGSKYMDDFLRANLINILIALLAVNAATLGIVLSKVREIMEARGSYDGFEKTKAQSLLSIREQIGLMVASIVVLTVDASSFLASYEHRAFIASTLLLMAFFYAIGVLHDTAKSVFVILDYKANGKAG
jgi:hypothetical protein